MIYCTKKTRLCAYIHIYTYTYISLYCIIFRIIPFAFNHSLWSTRWIKRRSQSFCLKLRLNNQVTSRSDILSGPNQSLGLVAISGPPRHIESAQNLVMSWQSPNCHVRKGMGYVRIKCCNETLPSKLTVQQVEWKWHLYIFCVLNLHDFKPALPSCKKKGDGQVPVVKLILSWRCCSWLFCFWLHQSFPVDGVFFRLIPSVDLGLISASWI